MQLPGLASRQFAKMVKITGIAYALLVNSSRAIIYADKTENFAAAAREAAQAVQREMAGYLHDKGIIPCKA